MMILQITLGDIIGWIITLTSVGVVISFNVKIKNTTNEIKQKATGGTNIATMNVGGKNNV